MKRNIIATSIALGALALSATVPASAGVFDFFDRFDAGNNVIDTQRGNDNRDARDSTVLRNDVDFNEPMPGATAAADEPRNPAGQSWTEHMQAENMQRGPDTASDALPAAAATDSEGDAVRAGVPSDSSSETVHSSADATAGTDDSLDDAQPNSAQPDAVTPSDGGGEMGVPGPRDSSAETDSFEGARDTAAGVDSTRGAGGSGN